MLIYIYIISIIENIKTTLDEKNYGCGVFIDLKHLILLIITIYLQKLEHGIRGVSFSWFKSYLKLILPPNLPPQGSYRVCFPDFGPSFLLFRGVSVKQSCF